MNGILTIRGPLDELSRIAEQLHRGELSGVTASVEPAEVEGWTVERARALLARLASKQRAALTMVVEGDGRVDGDDLRGAFGNAGGQVRGLTGPISKHVNNLIAEGVLPVGTRPPTTTEYDPDNRSFQRTLGLIMRAELVPVFRDAMALTPASPKAAAGRAGRGSAL